MNKLVYICTITSIITLTGCQTPVKVTLEGTDTFPAELVGTWKSDHNDWQITFEENGTISSIHHLWGGIEIFPGRVNQFVGPYGNDVVFDPDTWTVFYSAADHTLTVEIVLKYFSVEIGEGVLQGAQKDAFIGPIEDGQWYAEWINLPEFTAYVPEPHELPVDPESNIQAPILFEKVATQ